jgi:hypothetical protein
MGVVRRPGKSRPWLIVAIMLGLSATALGDPEHIPTDEAYRQAKVLRDQGAAAVQAHDFAAALDFFERAYALHPSPNLLFNIGVARERLDRPDGAVTAFEAFLTAATDPPVVARDFAQARLIALAPTPRSPLTASRCIQHRTVHWRSCPETTA